MVNPLIASLPLVAAALTEQTGIKVEIGGTEACTDGKCIHLPALPLDADDSLASVARGLLDHEAAHCLFTDMALAGKGDAVERWFTNMLEDIRVERCMAERYAGSYENFRSAALHVFSKREDGGDAPENLPFNWSLMYMRAWQIPELARQCRHFEKALDKAAPGLKTKLQFVLDEAKAGCTSTEKAGEYARKLAQMLRDYRSPAKNNEPQNTPEEKEAEKKGGESGLDGSKTSENTGIDKQKTRQKEPQACTEEGVDAQESSPFSCLFGAGAEEKFPRSMGEQMAGELSEHALPGSNCALHTARDVDAPFPEMPEALKKQAVSMVSSLHRYLVGKLQADTLEGVKPSEAGRINPRKLYRASVQDSRVFLRPQPARLVRTAVHIMLDCSLSTSGIIAFEVQSALALSMALQNIRGMSVGMSVFPVAYQNDYGNSPGVAWLLRQGQRVSHSFPMPGAYSTTPMDCAVFWATAQMRRLKERRKILLIFTDGEPDNRENTLESVKQAEASGIEVYGISYRTSAIRTVISQSTIIHDMRQLPSVMKELLVSTLHTRC